mgnify:CR=1 FL=1
MLHNQGLLRAWMLQNQGIARRFLAGSSACPAHRMFARVTDWSAMPSWSGNAFEPIEEGHAPGTSSPYISPSSKGNCVAELSNGSSVNSMPHIEFTPLGCQVSGFRCQEREGHRKTDPTISKRLHMVLQVVPVPFPPETRNLTPETCVWSDSAKRYSNESIDRMIYVCYCWL